MIENFNKNFVNESSLLLVNLNINLIEYMVDYVIDDLIIILKGYFN